jgi:hypothetical protein
MTHQIMTFWFKRQPKLIHDYSLVGYILSPHPQIMNDARERMLGSPIYSDAVKRLIGICLYLKIYPQLSIRNVLLR